MQYKFRKTSGILIPKTHALVEEIKYRLTRRMFEYDGSSKWIEFFEDLDKFILIPRYYNLDGCEIVDDSNVGDDITIVSNIVPRTNSQKQAISLLVNQDNGVLKLEPGRGKTVTTIAAICEIKKKSIIFVHKDSLIKNWTSEFLKHTSLVADDIGKLTTKNYVECLKKPIVLCTPHIISIMLKKPKFERIQFLDILQSSGIGMMVIDECHVGVGPEQFSKASLMLNTRKNWGLSATPSRSDDCNDIIKFHLGDVHYIPPDENETMIPNICRIKFDFQVYSKHKKYIQWGGKFNQTKYANMMKNSEPFKEYLKSVIVDAHTNNRNMLILGTTILPILELAEFCELPKEQVGVFMAGAYTDKKYKKILEKVTDTKNLHEAFHDKQVVYSTYQMARDGNNNPNLDCLIMLTTTSNCEQAIGRILRLKDGKKQPLVIDLIDTGGPKDRNSNLTLFERYANDRLALYLEKGWEVNTYELKEGKLHVDQY